MFSLKTIRNLIFLCFLGFLVSSCGTGVDARKYPPQPDLRVKKNIEEGRGFKLSNIGKRSTNFQFASSNPIWRASLDVLEFAPLLNANYSGGIIITDWISSDNQNLNEFYKITIKFLSNEIRSDALKITLHEKKCNTNNKCKISEIKSKAVENEISKKILRTAALYEKEDLAKKKKNSE